MLRTEKFFISIESVFEAKVLKQNPIRNAFESQSVFDFNIFIIESNIVIQILP